MKIIKPLLLLFIWLTFQSCQSEPEKESKPNLIFILVDDLGWKDVGFMGSTFYETPNIDRLAKSGMYFTNAYAACAVCSPTRASILTGKYPARIGITDWIRGRFSGVEIPENKQNPMGYDTFPKRKFLTPKNPWWMELEEITLAELLKENGYTTGHIGKWHLGREDWYPEGQGFDFNAGGTDYGQPPTYFDPYTNNGFSIENLPGRDSGEYLTDREAVEAVNFIQSNVDKPFYLNMWHYTVHTPLQARADLIEKYKNKQAQNPELPQYREEDSMNARYRSREPLKGQRNPIYAAMIESLDNAVGDILSTLDSLNLRENTIIVFFSDNGGHIVATDNSPLRLGKGHAYEGGIREPMIVSWPAKIQPNTKSDFPISSIDFLPTLCNLSQTQITENQVIDGIDFSDILFGKGEPNRNTLYWHFPHYWWGNKVQPYSIIREGNYKLIKRYETDSFELFDLKDDIGESNNLAASMPDKVLDLNDKLEKWLVETGAKIPIENPDF
jgi:arylsulfatase A-like enzyme